MPSKVKKILKKPFFSENILIISGALLLLTYFIYHTISGDRGLLVSFELKKELGEKKEKLEKIIEERKGLEYRAKSLNSNSLDLDLLDEISRRDLGLIKKDEHVVYPNNISE